MANSPVIMTSEGTEGIQGELAHLGWNDRVERGRGRVDMVKSLLTAG